MSALLRASETTAVLENIAGNQENIIIEAKNGLDALTDATKHLDTNNKNTQDKIKTEVGELAPPLEAIATNIAAHGSHASGLFRDTNFRHTVLEDGSHSHNVHNSLHHSDGGHHGGYHQGGEHNYRPKVTIIANRTTNLIPVQSGNVQADGAANSQSVSNDENSPVEGDTECNADFLGSFLCNIKLQLGSRKSGGDVSERRSDITEEEGEDDLDKDLVADIDILLLHSSKEEGDEVGVLDEKEVKADKKATPVLIKEMKNIMKNEKKDNDKKIIEQGKQDEDKEKLEETSILWDLETRTLQNVEDKKVLKKRRKQMRLEKKKARKNKRDEKKDNQAIKKQQALNKKEVASRGFGKKEEEFVLDPVLNIITFVLDSVT